MQSVYHAILVNPPRWRTVARCAGSGSAGERGKKRGQGYKPRIRCHTPSRLRSAVVGWSACARHRLAAQAMAKQGPAPSAPRRGLWDVWVASNASRPRTTPGGRPKNQRAAHSGQQDGDQCATPKGGDPFLLQLEAAERQACRSEKDTRPWTAGSAGCHCMRNLAVSRLHWHAGATCMPSRPQKPSRISLARGPRPARRLV